MEMDKIGPSALGPWCHIYKKIKKRRIDASFSLIFQVVPDL
jgi:hypothetical protein